MLARVLRALSKPPFGYVMGRSRSLSKQGLSRTSLYWLPSRIEADAEAFFSVVLLLEKGCPGVLWAVLQFEVYGLRRS